MISVLSCYYLCLSINVLPFMLSFDPFVPLVWLCACLFRVCACFYYFLCVHQIVGNGSEQQLQRELEDVLMDPSVADTGPGPLTGMDSLGGGDHGLLSTTASSVPPSSDPLNVPPPKLEMVLPVQTAQESELNERSYRGEL